MPAGSSCPIAYDHTYDLNECAVCGWRGEGLPAEPRCGRSPLP